MSAEPRALAPQRPPAPRAPAGAAARGLPAPPAALWTLPVSRLPEALPPRRTGLSGLLAATARRHPGRIVLADAEGKAAWSGRPAMTWSYAAAAEIVARLARALRGWRLPPGSRIGLWFPGSTEGLVAHLAVEAAGHVPCALPPAWDDAQVAAGVEAAGLAGVLTQARIGARRPAETLCRVAAGYFGLRYLAAFGPGVPDGVVNLDALVLERGATAEDTVTEGGGLVGFAGGDPTRPVHRPGEALLAGIAAHLAVAGIEPGERVLTLLPPHDLRGLVTGLGAALMAGAGLECLAVPDGPGLATALARPVPTHLVATGFLEPALAGMAEAGALPEAVRSLTLVRRAPCRLTDRDPRLRGTGPRVVDSLVLDEDAVVSGIRGAGDLAFLLAEPAAEPAGPGLLALRREPDGRLALRGPAARSAPLRRGIDATPAAEAWRTTRFSTTLFAGTATGLAAAG